MVNRMQIEKIFLILYMVDYNFIKNVYNIKFDNKKKSLEQYESFINILLLNIAVCESYINSIEFLKNNCDVSHENFDIKYFLKILEHIKYKRRKRRIFENNIIIIQDNDEEKFYYNMKYYYHENIVIELENLFRKNKKEYEYEYLNKKENVKKKKREIHKEKFNMCIHKFKILLPDNLIYKIGNFL